MSHSQLVNEGKNQDDMDGTGWFIGCLVSELGDEKAQKFEVRLNDSPESRGARGTERFRMYFEMILSLAEVCALSRLV